MKTSRDTQREKSDMVAIACDPTGEAEAGGLHVKSQPKIHSRTQLFCFTRPPFPPGSVQLTIALYLTVLRVESMPRF